MAKIKNKELDIITYLINLETSKDRLIKSTNHLNKANIKFERISAIDGRDIILSEIKDYDDKATIHYMGRSMSTGEIGCYYSHKKSIEKFLKTDSDYLIVLEDDMAINKDFLSNIKDIILKLNNDYRNWYLVNLGRSNKFYTSIKKFKTYTLCHAHYFPMTARAILWSRQGAEDFYNYIDNINIFCPIDNLLCHWSSRNNLGFSTYPPIVGDNNFKSDIDSKSNIDGKIKKRNKNKRHLFYGLIKQKRLLVNKFHALVNKFFNSSLHN